MKYDKKKKKKIRDFFSEFSKFILFLFAVNYFICGIFILWVVQFQLTHTVTPEYISAEAVVTYFTAPIVAGMVGYFGKAAVDVIYNFVRKFIFDVVVAFQASQYKGFCDSFKFFQGFCLFKSFNSHDIICLEIVQTG